MITVLFRYDDYSALSPRAVDRGVAETLHRHGVTCLFGVVPALTVGEVHVHGDRDELPLDGDAAAWLRAAVESGLVEVGLHGWNHRTTIHSPPPTPSEFRALPYAEQLRILRRGRDRLTELVGRSPRFFVPPWNSYDTETVRAAEAAGFEAISAARAGPAPRDSRLRFVPTTCEVADIGAAVAEARARGDAEALIGVMLHPYDFAESGDARSSLDLPGLDAAVRWLATQPDVRLTSAETLLDTKVDTSATRFRLSRSASVDRLMPSRVAAWRPRHILASRGPARRSATFRFAATAVVYTAVIAAAWFVGRWAIPQLTVLPPLQWLVPCTVAAALLLTARRLVRAGAIYFRGAAILAGESAFLLSGLL